MGPIWTIFKRGLGTHQVKNITWGDFFKGIPTTQTDKVFGCECLDCHIKRHAIDH
jgi:hypothetical protein